MKLKKDVPILKSENTLRHFFAHRKNTFQLMRSMLECEDERLKSIMQTISREYDTSENEIVKLFETLDKGEIEDLIKMSMEKKNQDIYKQLNQMLTHELCNVRLAGELYSSDGLLARMAIRKDVTFVKCYQDDSCPISVSSYNESSVYPKLSKEEYSKVYIKSHMDNQEFINELFDSATVEEVIFYNKRGGRESNTNLSLFIIAYAEAIMYLYLNYIDHSDGDILNFNIFVYYIISISTITLDIVADNFITSVLNDVWLIIIDILPFTLNCMRRYIENEDFDLSIILKVFKDTFGESFDEDKCLEYIAEMNFF